MNSHKLGRRTVDLDLIVHSADDLHSEESLKAFMEGAHELDMTISPASDPDTKNARDDSKRKWLVLDTKGRWLHCKQADEKLQVTILETEYEMKKEGQVIRWFATDQRNIRFRLSRNGDGTVTFLNDTGPRHYASSQLPVISEISNSEDRNLLIALYKEVCTSWRMLTDVRFKLLGLVPAGSIAVLIALMSDNQSGEGLSPLLRSVVSVFGFLITLGLLIYDARNSELYDDLISRGRRLEEELGIDTGQFRGRRNPSNWYIEHDLATRIIYLSSLSIWLLALVTAWVEGV